MSVGDYFTLGLLMHLVADFFLQNEWQAINKVSLRHPASWLHSALHVGLLLSVFPVAVACAVGVTHLLIDTRVPLRWWRRVTAQSKPPQGGSAESTAGYVSFIMLQDQAAHMIVLLLAAMYLARLNL